MTDVVKPMTFDSANRWLAGRVNVPTSMGSAEIALSRNFPASVQAHAFFSAKVAEARVVEKIRGIADEFSRGKINLAKARTEIKTWLAGRGFQPDDVADVPGINPVNSMQNIASTARLNLVLKQNAAMANAVGRHEVSTHPDMMTRWPYFRYIALPDARPAHAALNNTVLPKDHPFWNTHTPPWDYGCRCQIEDCDAEEAENFGGINQAVVNVNQDGSTTARVNTDRGQLSIETPASGFVFDVKSAFKVQDMSRITNIPIRKAVLNSIAKFAKENDGVRFNCIPGPATSTVNSVVGSPAAVESFIDTQAAEFAKSGAFKAAEVEAGELSQELLEGLGMPSGNVLLGSGSGSVGLQHMVKNHAADLANGKLKQALQDTLFSKGVSPSLQLVGKKTYLNIYNGGTGAFTTLTKFGEKDSWEIVTAFFPDDEYARNHEVLRYARKK